MTGKVVAIGMNLKEFLPICYQGDGFVYSEKKRDGGDVRIHVYLDDIGEAVYSVKYNGGLCLESISDIFVNCRDLRDGFFRGLKGFSNQRFSRPLP